VAADISMRRDECRYYADDGGVGEKVVGRVSRPNSLWEHGGREEGEVGMVVTNCLALEQVLAPKRGSLRRNRMRNANLLLMSSNKAAASSIV
jgi:hypothetical protein